MCVLQRWLFRSFRWIVTSMKSIFSFSSKLWELDGWPEARQRGHRGGLGASEQSGVTQIPFFCITLFWQPPPTYGGYQKQNSGSWCGQWERSSRRYTNNNQHGQAGAESLPTIQEHISEAPTAAGIERQQQDGLQPEQPEHPQLSKSRRGEKTNPGVDCEPRSSAGQGSDNSSTTAWHVLSVSSLLWPTLSGSLALLCTTTVFIHFFQSVSQFPITFQFTLVFPSFLMITLIATFSALHRYMPQMRASLPCDFLASMSTPAQHPRLYIPQSVMDGRCFLQFLFQWIYPHKESYFRSNSLSFKGSLPLACYPDIGPFGNIMPLNSISAVSKVSILFSPILIFTNIDLSKKYNNDTFSNSHSVCGTTSKWGGMATLVVTRIWSNPIEQQLCKP